MNQAQVIGHIMAKTGIRGPEFARLNNVSKPSLYAVAKGTRKTAHIRKLISETIGLPESEIWPEKKVIPADPA